MAEMVNIEQRSLGIHPLHPAAYASHPVPGLEEWKQLWASWDHVTRQMIPDDQLLTKPIDLRNVCLFYLGHIPTFCDIKIVEATGLRPTEPHSFYRIFERGIDPDVDNPDNCHAHSDIPDSWPALDEILAFQTRVRERITQFYHTGEAYENKWTGRVMWLAFEHEVMHLETLLYMLLQSDKMRVPTVSPRPDFESLAAQAKEHAVENQWFDVPARTITVGLEDPETPEGPVRFFGWDVEKPSYSVHVAAFKAKGRPITNEEFAIYLLDTDSQNVPASWLKMAPTTVCGPASASGSTNGTNGANGHLEESSDVRIQNDLARFVRDKAVRTVFGPIPLQLALDWPVCASHDELAACARYMGGRIPTEEETRSIYYYAEKLRKNAEHKQDQRVPAVNGHLLHNGVKESPPPGASDTASDRSTGPAPEDYYADLRDANVGFRNWHPVPVTQNGDRLAGLGEMGGLWEATSSPLTKKPGFGPMKLYPAYSDDFYDNKHFVVLGGSWATHPRLAGRKTFVNWYQHNYPYAWIGARLVKDI